MKIPIGKYVKVLRGTDSTFDESFVGMEGMVVEHNSNGMTGNTNDDPLHVVRFDLNTVPVNHPQYVTDAFITESFWSEELELTNHNYELP